MLSEAEVVRLLNAPNVKRPTGIRDRTLLELFYGTGLRNSELRYLCLDDVDFANKAIHIHEGKGRKSRVIPL